jgi:hypothetical protein
MALLVVAALAGLLLIVNVLVDVVPLVVSADIESDAVVIACKGRSFDLIGEVDGVGADNTIDAIDVAHGNLIWYFDSDIAGELNLVSAVDAVVMVDAAEVTKAQGCPDSTTTSDRRRFQAT